MGFTFLFTDTSIKQSYGAKHNWDCKNYHHNYAKYFLSR